MVASYDGWEHVNCDHLLTQRFCYDKYFSGRCLAVYHASMFPTLSAAAADADALETSAHANLSLRRALCQPQATQGWNRDEMNQS